MRRVTSLWTWILGVGLLVGGLALPAGPVRAQSGEEEPAGEEEDDFLDLEALDEFSRESRPDPVDREAPAGEAELDSEEAGREIRANYDETLRTYDEILERATRETGHIDARARANERLIEQYEPRLADAEDRYSRLRVDFINRTIELRGQQERGEIGQETLDRLLAEENARYQREKEQLEADIAFFRQEVEQARQRLQELNTEREVVERRASQRRERAERRGEPAPDAETPSPSEAILGSVTGNLDRVDPYRTRRTLLGSTRCPGCLRFREPDEDSADGEAGPSTGE